MRLTCETFEVDVRLAHVNGRWVASADTPAGPTLGLGWLPREALEEALFPFGRVAEELLDDVPDVQYWG